MSENVENNIEAALGDALKNTGDMEALKAENARLEAALKAAEATVAEHWDRLLRKEAEMQNARRRSDNALQEARRYGLDRFLQELMMVFDSLDQGLATSKGTPDAASLLEGMTLTLKLLTDTLAKFEVQILEPIGEAFNPAMHEAISMHPTTEVAANHIIAVAQKGVLLHDRLIRPARVVVATIPAS